MTRPRKAVVTKQRKVHTYAELWHASRCVLKAGTREPKGSSWQFLSCAVLTAFAFEAYLNHVGPTVISCWEQFERLPPWAKFELLCERLGVTFSTDTGSRPLQTVSELLEFRNTMAHGRSEEVSPEPTHRDVNANLDGYLGQRPLLRWESLIEDERFAERARTDVEAVLQVLHDARPDPKEALFTFGMSLHRASLIP